MEQSRANLTMKKMILEGREFDEKTYECELLKYDTKEESIYLVLSEADVTEISLDAIYLCSIYRDHLGMECEGRITDRYTNHDGNILKLQIEKGFYIK